MRAKPKNGSKIMEKEQKYVFLNEENNYFTPESPAMVWIFSVHARQ